MAISILLGISAFLFAAEDVHRKAYEQYQAGSKAFVERRFDVAIRALRQSLELDPKQLRVMRLLGLSYQLAGQLADAEAAFRSAAVLYPNDAESWYYLGRLYYVRNFFDRSLDALQKSAKLAPKDARVRECLALTWEAIGDASAAEKEYIQARGLASPPATLDMNYGALLLKLNRVEESEPLLRKAVTSMPQSWQAHFELGRLYYLTGRMTESLRELEAAAGCEATEEEMRRTQAMLANVYTRLGRHEEAQRAAAAAEK
ncbi:MAG: tetratricopeptide repeat protein [Bryobacteraceae bacterium]